MWPKKKKKKLLRIYPIRIYEIMAPDMDCLVEQILDICDNTCCPIIDIAARIDSVFKDFIDDPEQKDQYDAYFARILVMARRIKDV